MVEGAGPRRRRGARGRARVRGRPVQARADRGRSPAGADLGADPALAVDVRARAARIALVATAVRARNRLHPSLGPGAPLARRRAVLPRVRARSDPRALAGRGRGRRRGPCRRSRRARVALHDRRLDRRRRTLAAPGRTVLRRLAGLHRPSRSPRLGELRLPRLADAARGDRRARPAHPSAVVRAGGPLRRRDARARHPRARHDDAHLRGGALRDLAAAVSARAGAPDAHRLSCHRRARGLCGGRAPSQVRSCHEACRAGARASSASPSCSCSPTSA